MRCYELLELGAAIAVNARAFLHGSGRLAETGVAEYWSASRSRLDRWARWLQRDGAALRSTPAQASTICRRARPVLEEILASEILTRVWTAVACAADRRGGATCVSPVVRSVLLGHLEARNRALHFLLRAQDQAPDAILPIHRLRQLGERWTDTLLAYLPPGGDVARVAFDQRRVFDFAEDVRGRFGRSAAARAWLLLRVGLHSCFGSRLSAASPSADLNARIGAAVVACLRPERFDDIGAFDAFWRERLEYTAAEAELLIDELLAEDDPERTSIALASG